MTTTVLLTGASSFTGLWFAEALAARGFAVVAPLRRPKADYDGVRAERVERLGRSAELVFDCPFASPAFMDLIASRDWAALAHHASDVEDYNKWSFDAVRGFSRNSTGADAVFQAMAARKARAVVVTGTVFEAGEGSADRNSLAANPYGLSKTLTVQAMKHFARWADLRFGKFVIANPIGPYEERRFGWYLFQTWFAGQTPVVRTPDYVRDNIPVPFLAQAYADYVARLLDDETAPEQRRPSGLVSPQGQFAQLVARESASRLGLDLRVDLARQEAFSEPYLRVNDEFCLPPGGLSDFWDAYVDYYSALRRAGMFN